MRKYPIFPVGGIQAGGVPARAALPHGLPLVLTHLCGWCPSSTVTNLPMGPNWVLQPGNPPRVAAATPRVYSQSVGKAGTKLQPGRVTPALKPGPKPVPSPSPKEPLAQPRSRRLCPPPGAARVSKSISVVQTFPFTFVHFFLQKI